MCNLYSLTKGQAAIRNWFRAANDRTGNLPLFPAIFPDQMAPIVRNGPDGQRELAMARWGMPGPPQFGGQPNTNIRNVSSPHWRGMARQAQSLRRSCNVVLRIRRHKAPQRRAELKNGHCSVSYAMQALSRKVGIGTEPTRFVFNARPPTAAALGELRPSSGQERAVAAWIIGGLHAWRARPDWRAEQRWDTPRDTRKVSIPRQSRGLYGVNRSKR